MREILFRGQDEKTEEWVYGSLLDLDRDSGYLYIVEPFTEASSLPVFETVRQQAHFVIPETVGRYTGKKDRNGRKIFEGDIIDATDEWWNSYGPAGHTSPIIEVKWDDFHCGFDPFADYDCDCGVYISASNCEVVGNRWDNPELLEETK